MSGEILGIFGPNGCGKTTLLKIISGIMSFENGEILINEVILQSANPISRKDTFYLGHSTGLYKNLTASENLTFIGELYQKDISNIDDILNSVGLGKNQEKLIKFFSKGMLQRLKLGACIISDCKILLLDEPLSGLDNEGLEIFSSFYNNWRNSNKTILIVSHDKDWLKNKTDRIIELN